MSRAPHELQYYLDKVTPRHQGKPKFMAMLAGVLQPFVDVQATLAKLPSLYDLDKAVGVQLDRVGVRVGRDRNVSVPVPTRLFALDDPLRGLDQGYWSEPFNGAVTVTRLDDATYRKLLRAKILLNKWDGSIDEAQDVLDLFFDDPETHVFVVDNSVAYPDNHIFSLSGSADSGADAGMWFAQDKPVTTDLSMSVIVSGKIPPVLFLFMLVQHQIAFKPTGVRIDYSITSVDRTPVFGLDMDNEFIGGLDHGSWGNSPDDLLNQVPF